MRRVPLLLASLLLAACELPQDPIGGGSTTHADVVGDAAGDTGTSASPVSCSVLSGEWLVTVCDGQAQRTALVVDGCLFAITSIAPETNGGSGALQDGRTLALSLPGGAFGPLECSAAMKTASFAGRCAGVMGTCDVAGVKAF